MVMRGDPNYFLRKHPLDLSRIDWSDYQESASKTEVLLYRGETLQLITCRLTLWYWDYDTKKEKEDMTPCWVQGILQNKNDCERKVTQSNRCLPTFSLGVSAWENEVCIREEEMCLRQAAYSYAALCQHHSELSSVTRSIRGKPQNLSSSVAWIGPWNSWRMCHWGCGATP